jgi:protein SCO1
MSRQLPLAARIGGPFELTTHDGRRLSSAELKGTPFALFFGFTHCPDVCPTTMLELSNAIKALGPDADRMRFLFVSVDPERDTPEQLKLYLSNFDPRITGLVGTPEEIAAVAKAYRAIYEKVPTKDGFTFNHTALVYLMGPDGRLVATLTYQESAETQLKKLRRLLGA